MWTPAPVYLVKCYLTAEIEFECQVLVESSVIDLFTRVCSGIDGNKESGCCHGHITDSGDGASGQNVLGFSAQ